MRQLGVRKAEYLHGFYFPKRGRSWIMRDSSPLNILTTNQKRYQECPSSDDRESIEKDKRYIPLTMKILLQNKFVGKDTDAKVASKRHVIMQSVRPRGIVTPMIIGLAVQTHRQFSSRFLLDSLYITMDFVPLIQKCRRLSSELPCIKNL